MTQSTRFDIAGALWQGLQDAPGLAGAKFRRNPRDPANLSKDGPRVAFFNDQSDGWIDDKGQQGKRRFAFEVGVIGPDEAVADADQVAAEAALRAAAYVLGRDTDGTGRMVGELRELQTVFKVEGVDMGGALVLTTFEIEYRRPRPART